MASAAWVPPRSTEPWLPLTIWNTMGTSQCPSVGRAMAPPWAPRGPSRHGQSTSQLQFSRYSPSRRHDSAMTFTSDGILYFGITSRGGDLLRLLHREGPRRDGERPLPALDRGRDGVADAPVPGAAPAR